MGINTVDPNLIVKDIAEELGISILGVLVFSNNDVVLASELPGDLKTIVTSLVVFINKINTISQVKVKSSNAYVYAIKNDELTVIFITEPHIMEGALHLLNKYVDRLIKASRELMSRARNIEPMVIVEGDEITEEDVLMLIDYFRSKLSELEVRGD
ncbi:hypothetical protein [Caldivirga sp. UBA161]|uniref:hypothetical protein n=1 Tax=Caldivirga sp. UBA161 TaxID=1915569 RepID=UPI0025C33DB0|nr:hypothetical protein [Caldivirga sp. UBA161]